ncbi:hypothetical protein NHX12_014588 [Muraenolepis orangiensis]|uniref:MADF domain-containing protein n=1 Tax=Muraenolepis orangiensis TaxID=630683 RepID=A0A9Q0D9C7_9TELE|nr:hypothetical protein NHX12_014588 [Muraenolepis orangiensis]
MCDFFRENAILWDIKKTDYRRVDKKAMLREDLAKAMGKTVKTTIAAHSGDIEAAEAACADIVVDGDSTPSTSSQHKGKRGQDDDQLLQSLQKRVHESGELLKRLAQPQPNSFLRLPEPGQHSPVQVRNGRSRINTILSELMDEESDGGRTSQSPHLFCSCFRATQFSTSYLHPHCVGDVPATSPHVETQATGCNSVNLVFTDS